MKKIRSFTEALLGLAKEKPIAKISIEELCERVGVKRQTFYYHFDDMGDFIDAIIIDIFEKRADKDGDLNQDARFVANLYSNNYEAVRNLLSSPYAMNIVNFVQNYLSTRSYERLASNIKYKNLPNEQIKSVSRIVASIITSESSYWINNEMKEDKEHLLLRFDVILKNVERMMVENALRGNILNNKRLDLQQDEKDKH